SAAFLRVAALVPRVAVEVVKQEKAGSGYTRIEIRVSNRGYLSTYGLPSARKLPHSEPLRLTSEGTGAKLVAPAESTVEVGHLDALYPDGEADRDHCPYRGHESRLGVGLPHHGVDTGEQHNRYLRE